jgi:alanyl aminopeptidase
MDTNSPSSGRLPSSVTPDLYTITLTIDPETPQFSGRVAIDITLRAPTRTITLHALELAIQRAEIKVHRNNLPTREVTRL